MSPRFSRIERQPPRKRHQRHYCRRIVAKASSGENSLIAGKNCGGAVGNDAEVVEIDRLSVAIRNTSREFPQTEQRISDTEQGSHCADQGNTANCHSDPLLIERQL
jgi:hypothetical protein